jgi:hypothetical protein
MNQPPRRLLQSCRWRLLAAAFLMTWATTGNLAAQALDPIAVEGQPLAGNAQRLMEALDFLGAPLPADDASALREAIKARDAKQIQHLLDPHVLVLVSLSPEARVKARRGPASVALQQGGYTPILLKVHNQSTVTKPLRISSPQAGPILMQSGTAYGQLRDEARPKKGRYLDLEIYTKQPMTEKLSGLEVEYAIALIHSIEAGKREVVLRFDVGQGTQDLGFRAEVPVLFNIRPAIPVTLSVKDADGTPTTGRFIFKDRLGRIYPPQAKRLAQDFYFQPQIYRPDGGTVLLPPGELTMIYGRGPEYRQLERQVTVSEKGEAKIEVRLQRWINPMEYGFYSGDHHIHAAGCQHYEMPTKGVFPQDMFLHVKGEALNVGCCLTWGPCYEFQRQFFEPRPHKVSEPFTILRYGVEVSGFGSQALGHVCLLNLREQSYPGSDGTDTKGWPTWTTPLMRWAKAQGAICGYAHSASGLEINPQAAAKRLLAELDSNKDGKLSAAEAARGLLPEEFATLDADRDGFLSEAELVSGIQRVSNRLPNHAIPEMNGIGAQEICVTTAQGLCDFISAMDTQRVPEWNCWYHIMNCGFPLKVSGETDFPCVSGSRVGQGRVYVQLGKVKGLDFEAWCEGLGKGRSYVSDGYAHAPNFTVNGKSPGDKVELTEPGTVTVKARVAFAAEMPLGTSVGCTPHDPYHPLFENPRRVELIVNGQAVASRPVPADDKEHDITFEVPVSRSSWMALRHFPQIHTNPVNVIVGGKPIRASRKSASWCIGTIEQLWRARNGTIAAPERWQAERTFRQAIETYRKIAAECPDNS